MLKFYGIEQGWHDSWEVHYVLATSPEDAAERYIKRLKARYGQSNHLVEARIYETTFDEFGVLQRSFDLGDVPILSIQVPD